MRCAEGAESLDYSRFLIIWPNYINSNKTLVEGRRISKEAACPDPLVSEMSEICQHFRLRHVVEVRHFRKWRRRWQV